MTTFDNFFGRATHIDINSRDSITFDNSRRLSKFFWIFSKNLNNKRIFGRNVFKSFFLQIFGMTKSVRRIKFRKNNCFGCNFFYDLAIWAVCVAIHRRQSRNRTFCSEVFPKIFVHKYIYKVLK